MKAKRKHEKNELILRREGRGRKQLHCHWFGFSLLTHTCKQWVFHAEFRTKRHVRAWIVLDLVLLPVKCWPHHSVATNMSWSEGNYSLWCSSALLPRTTRQVHLMLRLVFLCTCCCPSVLMFSLPAPVSPLFHVRCRRMWYFKTCVEHKRQQNTQIVEQKKRGGERGSSWKFSIGLVQNEGAPLSPSMVLEETDIYRDMMNIKNPFCPVPHRVALTLTPQWE